MELHPLPLSLSLQPTKVLGIYTLPSRVALKRWRIKPGSSRATAPCPTSTRALRLPPGGRQVGLLLRGQPQAPPRVLLPQTWGLAQQAACGRPSAWEGLGLPALEVCNSALRLWEVGVSPPLAL